MTTKECSLPSLIRLTSVVSLLLLCVVFAAPPGNAGRDTDETLAEIGTEESDQVGRVIEQAELDTRLAKHAPSNPELEKDEALSESSNPSREAQSRSPGLSLQKGSRRR